MKNAAFTISRRDFLRLFGTMSAGYIASPLLDSAIAILPAQPLERVVTLSSAASVQARTLNTTALYPTINATTIRHRFWADTRVEVLSTDDPVWTHIRSEEYEVEGFVRADTLQPLYVPPASMPIQMGQWAEVSASSTALRAFASPSAPPFERIGHGGTALVVDHLTLEDGAWIAIANMQGEIEAWSQARDWSPITEYQSSPSIKTFIVNMDQGCIQVETADEWITIPCSLPASLERGTYSVSVKAVSASIHHSPDMRYKGVPWATSSEAFTVAGCYWHGVFTGRSRSPLIEIPPFAARWLYHHIDIDTPILVR